MSLVLLAREEASQLQWSITGLVPGHSFAVYCPFRPKGSHNSKPLKTRLMRSWLWGWGFNTFSPCNNGILEISLRLQTQVKSVTGSLAHGGSKSSCTRRTRGRVSHSWEVGMWAVRIQASGLRPLPAYSSRAISKSPNKFIHNIY